MSKEEQLRSVAAIERVPGDLDDALAVGRADRAQDQAFGVQCSTPAAESPPS